MNWEELKQLTANVPPLTKTERALEFGHFLARNRETIDNLTIMAFRLDKEAKEESRRLRALRPSPPTDIDDQDMDDLDLEFHQAFDY